MLSEIQVTSDPGQIFSLVVDGQKVSLRLRYNTHSERFSMDLSIDETPRLTGRKVVTNVDLLKPFDFGIGSIFAAAPDGSPVKPTIDAFAARQVRLYHYAAP
jgi:hypothetical protein